MNFIKTQKNVFINAESIICMYVSQKENTYRLEAEIASSDIPIPLAEYSSQEEAADELRRLVSQLVVNSQGLVYIMPQGKSEVAS